MTMCHTKVRTITAQNLGNCTLLLRSRICLNFRVLLEAAHDNYSVDLPMYHRYPLTHLVSDERSEMVIGKYMACPDLRPLNDN